MSQVLSYTSIVSAGANWSNGSNVSSDNGSYADCDMLGVDGTSGVFEFAMSNPSNDPKVNTSHVLLFNLKVTGGSAKNFGFLTFYWQLCESGAVRASGNWSLTSSTDVDKTYTLSASEADSIGNYNNLTLKCWIVVTSGDSGCRVLYLDYAKLTIPELAVPSQITGVAATDGTRATGTRITWSSDSLADSYKIKRNGSVIATGVTGTSYDDGSGNQGQSYDYSVCGHNGAGDGAYSATNAGYSAPAPSSPSATDGLYTDKTRFSWGAVAGAASYKVYRNGSLLASGVTNTYYDDTTGTAGVSYSYTVKAHFSDGDTEASAADSGYRATSTGAGSATAASAASGTGSLVTTGTTWTGGGAAEAFALVAGVGGVGSESGLYGRLDHYASDYVFDHQPAGLQIAALDEETGALVAGPRTILTAETISCLHGTNDSVTIALGSVASMLERRLQPLLLRGTGGTQGGSEQEANPAPLCFGNPKNAPGVRLSTVEQIWLLHADSRRLASPWVSAVYFGQNTVDSDFWTSWIDADGSLLCWVFGTDVLDGTDVSFDVRDGIGGGLLGSTIEAASSLLNPELGVGVDAAAVSDLNLVFPWAVREYVADEITIKDFLNKIVGAFAWWGVAAETGYITMGLALPPDLTVPAGEMDESEIISVGNELPVPPARSVAIGYDVNPLPVDESRIVGAARGTDRSEWAQRPYRRLASSSPQAAAVYRSARTPDDYVTPLSTREGAGTVHRWLSANYGRPMRIHRIRCKTSALRFSVGQTVTLSFPRWNLNTPADFGILEISLNEDWTTEMVVWRPGTRYVLQGNSSNEILVTPDGAPLGV